jgi:hypothetical protein
MAQSQAKLSRILEFGGGDEGSELTAIEILITALSLQPEIDAAELSRMMGVLIEAQTLASPQRRKVLGWISPIKRVRAGVEEIKEASAHGELGPAIDA